MASLSDERWVRILADYSADPIWDRDGCMRDLAELPVSEPLKARLRAWEQVYDTHEYWRGKQLDTATFAAEGLEIARAVKRELPDWTVVYFDVSALEQYPDGPRNRFEYEIPAQG